MLRTRLSKFIHGCLLLTAAAYPLNHSQAATRDYAVEVTAQVDRETPAIQLSWRSISRGDVFSVARKSKDATSWTTLTNLPPGVLSFTDAEVEKGAVYEYRVAQNPMPSRGGTGYVLAGIDAPLVDQRGKLILLLDDTLTVPLASELARLEEDLVGDGWEVVRIEAGREETPALVKVRIQAAYQLDPENTKALFIFGHVPVPYSGDYTADGHQEHRGAWPADVYYADMDGVWTDLTVNNTSAERIENRNTPGDGKFDQSSVPSEAELQVGRVDLARMNTFDGRAEVELHREYLNKDHNFRHGITRLARRGFISDNFGEMNGEAFASSGYRNFGALFGSENITEGGGNTFFPTLKKEDYLFSYACGGGAYYFCNFVGGTGDFRQNDYKSAFTMLLGSYFGDWDAHSSFLRGAIASKTHGLAAVWAGRPHWFMQHMGLGETIGYSTRTTQNNGRSKTYHPQQYAGGVHVALMGDPTLRLHPVIPPSSPRALATKDQVQVTWAASLDENIVGYHVYRSAPGNGPYTRLTPEPIQDLSFVDNEPADEATYQVRAIKLESSPSGTYYNQSQGVFTSGIVMLPKDDGNQPRLSISSDGNHNIVISFNSSAGQTYRLLESVDFQNWKTNREVTALFFETHIQVPQSDDFTFFKVEVVPVIENPPDEEPVVDDPTKEPTDEERISESWIH